MLSSIADKYANLLPFDTFVVQLRASSQVGTSIGEQVVWTYAAYEIFANLYRSKSAISDVQTECLDVIFPNTALVKKISERVSKVKHPNRHITGHFSDKSFQPSLGYGNANDKPNVTTQT